MTFSETMKKFYDDHGYLVVERVLSDDDLAPARQRTDEIIADPGCAAPGVSVGREGDTVQDKSSPMAQNRTVRGAAFLARFDPVFRQFASHARIHELVRGLIGPRIKLFRDQMLMKPPGGQEKPLHQDQSYFRIQPVNDLVTAWIALDEATLENGCMRYVPGSHKYGIFDIVPDPERPVHHIPCTAGLSLPPPAPCPTPAGSIIFHHGCTLHCSDINHTETWRRAVILHFTTADARSENKRLNREVSMEID